MTINLFQDQIDLRERLRESLRKHKCVLAQAVTGAGKTVMAADMILRIQQRQKTSMFVVPRRQLLKQTADKFESFGIDFGYISAGKPANRFAPCQLATIGTLIKKMDKFPVPSICYIDEGHFSFDQTMAVAQYYLERGSWVVYLTATPKPGMDRIVQDVVRGESLAWMIDSGRLSKYRAFAPAAPDLSQVRKNGGEWHQGDLCSKMEHDRALVGNMVKEWNANAQGLRTIGYAASIAHAEIMAEQFREAGIPSAAISGKTPDDELMKVIKALATREIKIAFSCDLVTFGFDLEAASGMPVTIEAMLDAGPTLSIIKQSQKNGRVLRWKPDPAVILDCAGNIIHRDGTRNLGMPCDDRDWSIKSGAKAGASKASPVKLCPNCYGTHRPAPSCPYCGHIYVVGGRVIRQLDGTLVELRKEDVPKPRTMTESERAAFNAVVKAKIDGGMHPAHARNYAKKKLGIP